MPWHNIRHFMSWWKRGLLAAAPKAWQPTYHQAHVHCTENGFMVLRKDTGEQTELTAADAAIINGPAMDLTDCEITLHVPEEEALQSELQLPAAAEQNLHEVLGHEIERRTPFTKEQTYYGYSVSARDPVQKTMTVRFSAMPRSKLDSLLYALAGYGVKPHQACAGGADNMLPPEMQAPLPRSAYRAIAPPLALCLALGLLCAYIPLWQKRQALQHLEQEIQQLLPAASKLQQLRDQRQQAVTRSDFLNRQRNEHVPAIDLLEHISALLPDDTALRSLKLDGEHVTMTGESSNASRLIALIEDSPLLREPSFRSPVVHSDFTQREQFTITATMQRDTDGDDG